MSVLAIIALFSPLPDNSWTRAAMQDVVAAEQMIRANHPGFGPDASARHRRLLQKARDIGLGEATNAADLQGYAHALWLMTDVFADGHLSLNASGDIGQRPFLWPGFIAAWRGDRLLVAQSERRDLPAGATILACDGLPAKTLIRSRLTAQLFRPAEAGQYWARASEAFLSDSNARKAPPQRCTFRVGKRSFALSLRWVPWPRDLDRMLLSATLGERTSVGMTEPRPGVFHLAMPTFSPGEEDVARFRTMFDALASRRTELLGARAIVIDLRGNGGGSSSWSRDAARLLWGREAVDTRMRSWFRNTRVRWRVSPDNFAYLDEVVRILSQAGQTEIVAEVRGLQTTMRAAMKKGDPFVIDRPEKTPVGPPVATDLKTSVYVITDGGCLSACLDAVDVFKRFSNTTLIGAPTSADSEFLEVRTAPLPSGKGFMRLPMKEWLNRPRAAGEVYEPNIAMTGLDWSTRAFLDAIEHDLRRRKRTQNVAASSFRGPSADGSSAVLGVRPAR